MKDKTEKEIIYLDVDEEIPSIVFKIKNTSQHQIVLVVPKGALILQSLINLKLVKKKADEEKKKLSFATQDSIGKNLLIKLGYQIENSVGIIKDRSGVDQDNPEEIGFNNDSPTVPVHHFQGSGRDHDDGKENIEKSIEESDETIRPVDNFQTNIVREGTKPPRRSKLKLNFKKSFLIIMFIIILVAIMVFGPSAKVIITVIGEPFKQTQKIEIVEISSTGELAENQIGGKIVSEEAKAQEDFPATGKNNVGEKAKATITVYNSWSTETQAIAKGSIFKKDNLEFLLLSDINVPGATLSLSEGKISTNTGKTSAIIEAKEAGDNYNIGGGRFVIETISNEKQDKIYGETDKKITGGSTQEIKVISEQDYNLAVEKLENLAKEDAKKKLIDNNKNSQIFVDAVSFETIDKKSSKTVGSESDNFNLLVKIRATVMSVDENIYKNKFIDLVKKQVPNDKSLNLRENDTIETKIDSSDYPNKKLNTISNISTQLSPKLDLENIKKNIRFNKVAVAKERIKNDQIESIEIHLIPNYYPIKRLPIIQSRIKVFIEYE